MKQTIGFLGVGVGLAGLCACVMTNDLTAGSFALSALGWSIAYTWEVMKHEA